MFSMVFEAIVMSALVIQRHKVSKGVDCDVDVVGKSAAGVAQEVCRSIRWCYKSSAAESMTTENLCVSLSVRMMCIEVNREVLRRTRAKAEFSVRW